MVRVGIVAPSRRINPAIIAVVQALVESSGLDIELVVHPQCYLDYGHFAGSDQARLEAFLSFANDPELDAIWFARGGYGAARLLPGLESQLTEFARAKVYLGYSDIGFLFGGLLKLGCRFCAHGPLVSDVDREGGSITALRALRFLARSSQSELAFGLEPQQQNLAFNLTVLRSLLGTPWEPAGFSRATLWLEDVAEYTYATDRSMFQLSQSQWFKDSVAQVKIGRFSHVIENEVQFHLTSEEAVAFWAQAMKMPTALSADIGHDADNKIVPFGQLSDWQNAGLLG